MLSTGHANDILNVGKFSDLYVWDSDGKYAMSQAQVGQGGRQTTGLVTL